MEDTLDPHLPQPHQTLTHAHARVSRESTVFKGGTVVWTCVVCAVDILDTSDEIKVFRVQADNFIKPYCVYSMK